MKQRHDERAAAVRLLTRLSSKGGSFSTLLTEFEQPLTSDQRPRYRSLAHGLARWHWQLAPIVDGLLQRPLKARDQDLHWLMQLGLLQLEHQAMPDHAAVDTTVASARTLGKDWARGLVNAVLRRYMREREQRLAALDAAAAAAQPAWLWQALGQDWPLERDAIVAASNREAPMVLRVNRRKVSTPEYLSHLRAQGIGAEAIAALPAAVVLDQPMQVQALPGFAEGHFSVQDGSAQQAIDLLESCGLLEQSASMRLLDACAAPGGKFCQLLETADFADALALDVSADRVERIHQNLERLELRERARVQVADALASEPWRDESPFDLIVLDVPCSGSGVIRRHPDIKLTRRASDILALAAVQQKLLRHLWSCLAPGGHLLYLSCSVLREENEKVIATTLDQLDDACEVELEPTFGERCRFGWQRLPGGVHDGFYQCLLRRLS